MFKNLITALIFFLMTQSLAINAIAAFGPSSLIRVTLQQTGGNTEIATNLGTVSTILSAGGSYGGGANAFTSQAGGTNFAADSTGLSVVYFAGNPATNELWITGSSPAISLLKGSIITGILNNVTAYYNSLGGTTISADASNAESYRVMADATTQFGQFGGAIVAAGRPYTEANLAALASGGSVTQKLYYFSNYTKASTGVLVATITTNADGSTSVAPPSTPPSVSITTPPPATSTSATVSISFTATDTVGVTAYQLTSTASAPTASDPNWNAVTPATSVPITASYTFNGMVPGTPTPETLYVWAKDVAGNVSPAKSASTSINIPVLTVSIVNNNSGVGQVNSDIGGINCFGNSCSAPFDSTTFPGPVTLTALADSNSIFLGWSNNSNCSGTGTCVLTMSASTGVTATFDRLQLIKIPGLAPPYYGLIQNAFSAAGNGNVIEVTSNSFNESPVFNKTTGTVVTLKGGFDAAFDATPSNTSVITGALSIKGGELIISGIVVRP